MKDSWANIKPFIADRWEYPSHTEPTEGKIAVGSFTKTMANHISYAGMKVIWRKK